MQLVSGRKQRDRNMDGQLGRQEFSQFDGCQSNRDAPSKEEHRVDENRFWVNFFIKAEALKECAAPALKAFFFQFFEIPASKCNKYQRENNTESQEDYTQSV